MLTENTGAHFLDSGGAYGRAWERNRKIADFHKTPTCTVEVDQWTHDGKTQTSINIGYNLFHYLTNFLTLSKEAKKLQRQYNKYCKAHADEYELTNMEEFAASIDTEAHSENSYNDETLLSGTIQYYIFNNDGNSFILLQIHGGCDVRGGYTDAKIFEMKGDSDYFFIAQKDAYADCECGYCMADSCDAGYSWDCETSDVDSKEDLAQHIGYTPLHHKETPFNERFTVTEDKTLLCKRCKKPLTFSVCEGC
jgi:hypothetical protein